MKLPIRVRFFTPCSAVWTPVKFPRTFSARIRALEEPAALPGNAVPQAQQAAAIGRIQALDTALLYCRRHRPAQTGKSIEWIGRIYSHLTVKYMLGFKCLNLALWTGSYLLHLDCSLHVEMGKKGDQGMSRKEAKKDLARAERKKPLVRLESRKLFTKSPMCWSAC